MPNPRQPVSSENSDLPKNRLDDPFFQEAGSSELEDDDFASSETDDSLSLEDDDDLDY